MNVPVELNVWLKLPPCEIFALENAPPSLVTVCDAGSLFFQMTVSPFFTMMVFVLNAKLAINTDTYEGAGCVVCEGGAGAGGVCTAGCGFTGAVV